MKRYEKSCKNLFIILQYFDTQDFYFERRETVMIKAAVCDDEKIFTKKFVLMIKEFFDTHNIQINVSVFDSGTDFILNRAKYDIVFLDINIPDVGGFEIAKQITDRDRKTLIIFVTEHDELVYSSLKFRPFRFIRKRRLQEELADVLRDVISEISKQSNKQKLIYLSNEHDMPIEIKDIEYVEVIGHRIHAHLKGDNVVSFYGSLSNTAARLMKYGFIRIHKSYIINAEQIAFSKKIACALKAELRFR